jgi:hypothetical protein
MESGQSAQVGAERDLYLKNLDMRRSALDNLERSVGGARADELERQQFNLGQQNKERMGQLDTEMGYGALGSAERAGVLQRLISQDQARTGEIEARKGEK